MAGKALQTRAARERTKAQRQALQAIHSKWCERHPERAAEERELRQRLREQRESFGHKVNGTVETHAHASRARQGAMVRLYRTGAITIHQWGASMEIAAAYERVTLSAGVATSWSMVDRVDISPSDAPSLGGVWNEMSYSRWRLALPTPGPVLAMIVDDVGLDAAARRFSMHKRRAKRLLIDALDMWNRIYRDIRRDVDEAAIGAAQAAII